MLTFDTKPQNAMTPKVRRRMVRGVLKEASDRRAAERGRRRAAWIDEAGAMSSATFATLPLSDRVPPFAVGQGHFLIECGGYFGCTRCAGVSGWWTKHAKVGGRCSGTAPIGSRGPIERLRRAELPHRQRSGQGSEWPSGETCPTLGRVTGALRVAAVDSPGDA